jgi:hypothetical protein
MNCFQLLKTVLDEVLGEMEGSDADKIAAIRAKEDYLRKHYRKLASSTVALDYRDPATRYVYLCTYVTSHANIVYQRIKRSDELASLFERGKVQVACIGGGPGSDLLGVLKYAHGLPRAPSLKFFLYDRETAWSESWSDVDDKLGTHISTYFQQFDVTDPESYERQTKYLSSDLFTMIYFVSEVHALRAKAEDFFSKLFAQAKQGALFLFVDNAASVFYEWFDQIWKTQGIELVEGADNITMGMPGDEQKSDLGEHFTKYLSGYPKLDANIAWRLLRKP